MIVCQTVALKCQSEASDALSLVGLPQLMRLTSGAEAVKIALIDGPVALDHADLARETIHLLPGQPDAKHKIQNSVACVHGTQVAGVLHARRSAAAPGICPTCTLLIRPIFSAEAIETDSRSPLSANPQDAAAAIREAVAAKARIIDLSVASPGRLRALNRWSKKPSTTPQERARSLWRRPAIKGCWEVQRLRAIRGLFRWSPPTGADTFFPSRP